MVAEEGFAAVAQSDDVHHETKVEWDNRPSELRLATKAEHASLHGSPEVHEDQQELSDYPTLDDDEDDMSVPERPPRQRTLTEFEE